MVSKDYFHTWHPLMTALSTPGHFQLSRCIIIIKHWPAHFTGTKATDADPAKHGRGDVTLWA